MNESDRLLLQKIYSHLDGTLTPEALAALDELLASNRAAADMFVQCAEFEGLLERFHANEQVEDEASRLLLAMGLSADENTIAASKPVASPIATPAVAQPINQPLSSVSRSNTPFMTTTRLGLLTGGVMTLALIAAFAAGLFSFQRPGEQIAAEVKSPRVAEVAYSIDALWGGASLPDEDGWLPAGAVQLRRGQVEIRFVSGVVAVLKAPAEFQAVSAEEGMLKSGSMTARVDGKATSFRIHTPTAEVVDLGTEFGLSVSNSGETDVAVFDGIVDVCSDPKPLADITEAVAITDTVATPRRLTAGEALRVNWQGQFRRIMTVTDDSFPALARSQRPEVKAEPPLIASVSDTLRDGDKNPLFYRIVSHGFGEDCLAYVDRDYQWNGIDESGIPEFLLGADYVMPFNADKAKNLEITLMLDRPATIYILFDDRGNIPGWLKKSFVDTGFDIGMDEGPYVGKPRGSLGDGAGESIDYIFSIWKQKVSKPGQVVLGPRGGLSSGRAMYGIVAVPLPK